LKKRSGWARWASANFGVPVCTKKSLKPCKENEGKSRRGDGDGHHGQSQQERNRPVKASWIWQIGTLSSTKKKEKLIGRNRYESEKAKNDPESPVGAALATLGVGGWSKKNHDLPGDGENKGENGKFSLGLNNLKMGGCPNRVTKIAHLGPGKKAIEGKRHKE